MLTMHDLAARCEAASGPDKELDIAIHSLIDPQHVAYMDADFAKMKAAIEARGPEAIKHRLPGLRSHTHNPPPYTASLDAAMTLLDPAWGYEQRRPSDGEQRHAVELWWVPEFPGKAHGIGATPALALSAASLRARSLALTSGETE